MGKKQAQTPTRRRIRFRAWLVALFLLAFFYAILAASSRPDGMKRLGDFIDRFSVVIRARCEELWGRLSRVGKETHSDSGADAGESVRVFFAPQEPDEVNGIQQELVKLIQGAKQSVECAIYELRDGEIAAALIDAQRRGVRVNVVSDSDNAKTEAIRACMDAGIPVTFDGRSALMHNKFCLVDNRFVWTGSTNFTPNCFFRNNNNSLLIDASELAQNYAAEFREMFADKKFGPRSPRGSPFPVITLDKVNLRVFFAPEDKVEEQVQKELRGVRTRVRVMAFVLPRYRWPVIWLMRVSAAPR